MATARPFSPLQDPFTFEIGWVNALSALLALCLLLLSAGSQHTRPAAGEAQSVSHIMPRNVNEAQAAPRSFASTASSPTATKPV